MIKYKPSADCAYTQLISKIKGVNDLTKATSTNPQPNNETIKVINVPKTDVEVKKISNGLMLAQYYNSDSEDEESNQTNGIENVSHTQESNENSQTSLTTIPTLCDEIPIPPEILCPPSDLRVIIDKTASYVLKNGKDFEEILRAKNDQRFTFLQYMDPYYKYYIYKLTGTICPEPVNVLNTQTVQKNNGDVKTDDSKSIGTVKPTKHIGEK